MSVRYHLTPVEWVTPYHCRYVAPIKTDGPCVVQVETFAGWLLARIAPTGQNPSETNAERQP